MKPIDGNIECGGKIKGKGARECEFEERRVSWMRPKTQRKRTHRGSRDRGSRAGVVWQRKRDNRKRNRNPGKSTTVTIRDQVDEEAEGCNLEGDDGGRNSAGG